MPQPIAPVTSTSRARSARRARGAAALAEALGFDETRRRHAWRWSSPSWPPTSLKHAGGGEIAPARLGPRRRARRRDRWRSTAGPACRRRRCLRDGYSTAGSPGTGLGAIARLSTRSTSTRARARHGAAARASGRGRAATPAPRRRHRRRRACRCPAKRCAATPGPLRGRTGERCSCVADGLGHGPRGRGGRGRRPGVCASIPTDARRRRCCERLHARAAQHARRGGRGRRGRPRDATVRFAGVGNIAGAARRRQGSRSHGLAQRHRRPRGRASVQEFDYPLAAGAHAGDALRRPRTRWDLDAYPACRARHPAPDRRRALPRLRARPRRRHGRGRAATERGAMSARAPRRVELGYEHDVVLARQRARQIAELLGFDAQDQTRIATAVSEIARNAFSYAGGGRVEFRSCGRRPDCFVIRVRDQGRASPNLDGDPRRALPLADRHGPRHHRRAAADGRLRDRRRAGQRHRRSRSASACRAARRADDGGDRAHRRASWRAEQPRRARSTRCSSRTRSCCRPLDELRAARRSCSRLNRELEDTNRGVVALYAELDERAEHLRRADEMQVALPLQHEPRVPHAAELDPRAVASCCSTGIDGDSDGEQEKQVRFIRQVGRGPVGAGQRPARPRQDRGRQDRRSGRRTFDVADLFGALRGMLRPLLVGDRRRAGLRRAGRHAAAVHRRGEGVADPAQLHLQRAQVHRARRGARVGAPRRRTTRSSFSRRRHRHRHRARGPGADLRGVRADRQPAAAARSRAPASACRCRASWPGCSAAACAWRARSAGLDLLARSSRSHFKGPPRAGARARGEPRARSGAPPVLVVEDNRETLFIYEKFLKGSGFQVLPARTLDEAREWLATVRPVAVCSTSCSRPRAPGHCSPSCAQATRHVGSRSGRHHGGQREARARALGADAFHQADRARVAARRR